VRVQLQGDGDGCVVEPFLDDHGMHARAESQPRPGVAQIVQPDRTDPAGAVDELPEQGADPLRSVDRRSPGLRAARPRPGRTPGRVSSHQRPEQFTLPSLTADETHVWRQCATVAR
jgi:hypothetical protein